MYSFLNLPRSNAITNTTPCHDQSSASGKESPTSNSPHSNGGGITDGGVATSNHSANESVLTAPAPTNTSAVVTRSDPVASSSCTNGASRSSSGGSGSCGSSSSCSANGVGASDGNTTDPVTQKAPNTTASSATSPMPSSTLNETSSSSSSSSTTPTSTPPPPPPTTTTTKTPTTTNAASNAPPTIPLKKTDLGCKGVLDQNTIEGHMTIHVKKLRKNLFKPSKTTYYVVADERKPVLEIYSNETKTELVYLLSLHQALLCFESDDANIVMEKCFCVEVKTWKKKHAVYLKTQRFIFYEEDQVRMLVWVKCIHLAIKNSTKVEMERDLFRLSMMTTTSAISEQAFSDDDMMDRDVTEEDESSTSTQQQQQPRGKSTSPWTESVTSLSSTATGTTTTTTTTATATTPPATNTFRGSARERINQMFLSPRGNQKSIATMLSSSVSQPSTSSTTSSPPVGALLSPSSSSSSSSTTSFAAASAAAAAASPQQSAAEALLAPTLALLHAAMEKKPNGATGSNGLSTIPEKNTLTTAPMPPSSTTTTTTFATTAIGSSDDSSGLGRPGPVKDKTSGGSASASGSGSGSGGGFHFSPKIINNFQQTAKIPIKGLHLGGGKTHNTTTTTSTTTNAQDKSLGLSSTLKESHASDWNDDDNGLIHSRPNQDNLFQLVRRKSLARLQAALQAKTEAEAAAEAAAAAAANGNNKSTAKTSAWEIAWWRLSFLLLTCAAGWWQTSMFVPLAAAGALGSLTPLVDEYETTAVLAIAMFWLSQWNFVLGVCMSCGLVYSWTFGDFKTRHRQRRVQIADKLVAEEQLKFAHVGIPNWLRQPDVDRVEWVNRVWAQSWPYMKIAIRNTLMECLNPLLDAQKPVFISSLGFVRIDLGNKVPHISGVKYVSSSSCSTDEATIDIEVRVVTDKTFVAELKMASAVGAGALVSLRDLFIVGTLRLSFTPMATYWPCFSGLRLCFINQPVVDFSLKAAKINIANVPFASEWLHTFLHDLLVDYFVWPKVADIPLWDPDPSVFSGSNGPDNDTSTVSSLEAFCAAVSPPNPTSSSSLLSPSK